MNVAFALAEVVWILSGRRDVEMLQFYNSRIADYSDDKVVLNAAYGHRLRHAHGFDQLEDVIRTLKKDPGSRQATLCIWHPDDRGWDFVPSHNGGLGDTTAVPHVTADRACNLMSHLMIRDGKLDWLQVMRSNDFIWGLPYNLMQWLHLMEYVAAQVSVSMGTYTHMADSLHIYHYHRDEAAKITPFDLYARLQFQHAAMSKLPITVVAGMEEDVRTSDSNPPLPRAAAESHSYWNQVLKVFRAHRLFKEGEDIECVKQLANCHDLVLGAAQARFYYSVRWHKMPSLAERITQHWPKVAHWIKGESVA